MPAAPDIDQFEDDGDDYSPADSATTQPSQSDLPTSSDPTQFLSEPESMSQGTRLRPSSDQIDELRKRYGLNPHPTTDERQAMADSIGMSVYLASPALISPDPTLLL